MLKLLNQTNAKGGKTRSKPNTIQALRTHLGKLKKSDCTLHVASDATWSDRTLDALW